MNNGRGGRRRGAGRPPGARNKATLAREKTEPALNVLESIMNDEEAPASVLIGPQTSYQVK